MLCHRCGSYVPDDAKSCDNCGASLTDSTKRAKKRTSTMILRRRRRQQISPELTYRDGSMIAGRFEVKDVLGSGSLGAVYKVYDTDLDMELALKVIYPTLIKSSEQTLELRKTLRRVRKLTHANIVRIYDEGMDGKNFYFTMQYLEGLTLRKIINLRKDKQQVFNLSEVEPILSQISQALEYAHATLYHGYLKPQNIIVLPDLLKITDLGLALALSPEKLLAAQKKDSESFPYLSPESRSNQTVDSRSDIYSLGVLLGEMLTGEIYDGQFDSIVEKNPDAEPLLDVVFRRAIDPDPSLRYQHVADFMADISSILEYGELAEDEEVPTVISNAENPYDFLNEALEQQNAALLDEDDEEFDDMAEEAADEDFDEDVEPPLPLGIGDEPEVEETPATPTGLPSSTADIAFDPSTPTPVPPTTAPASSPFAAPLSIADQHLPQEPSDTESNPSPFSMENSPISFESKPVVAPMGTPGVLPYADQSDKTTDPQLQKIIEPPVRQPTLPPLPVAQEEEDTGFSRMGIFFFVLGIILIFGSGGIGLYLKFVYFPQLKAKRLKQAQQAHKLALTHRKTILPKIPLPKPPVRPALPPVTHPPKARLPEKRAIPKTPVTTSQDAGAPPEKRIEATTPQAKPKVTKRQPPRPKPKKRKTLRRKKRRPRFVARRKPKRPKRRKPKKRLKVPPIPKVKIGRNGCPPGMVLIRKGGFRMGSAPNDELRSFGELPLVYRYTKSYCIDRYEYPGRGRRPKTRVTWFQAKQLCEKQHKRLCTEIEWEKACKGGKRNYRYPYGNKYNPNACNTRNALGQNRSLTISGRFRRCRSPYGIYDMSGNAAEWTSSTFRGSRRVIRGGSAKRPDWDVRCASRSNAPPSRRKSYLGFRCCADPK